MWRILYLMMRLLPGHYPKMAMWVAMEKLGISNVLSDEGFHVLQLLAFTGERFVMPWRGGGICALIKWQCLYWRSKIPEIGCDRFAVRDFVRSRGCGSALVPLLPDETSVWVNENDIDFDILPNSFVLKCTNGSGMVEIVRDKRMLNVPAMREKMKDWLRIDMSAQYREFQYGKVQNRLICEQLLGGERGKVPKDYKIMCSDGKPLFAWVDLDRFTGHERFFVDLEFKPLKVHTTFVKAKEGVINEEKPDNWDAMLEIASRLSKGIPIVRVDLYSENGHVYFGELTFTPGGGIEGLLPFSFSQESARKVDLRSFVDDPLIDVKGRKFLRNMPAA